MGQYEQSLSFNMPSGTLQDRISKGKTGNPKLGRSSVFTPRQEESIATYDTLIAKMLHCVNSMQLQPTAFDFAEQNKIKCNFNRQNFAAGKDWLYNFLRRNMTISAWKQEATSLSRILGCSQEVA